MAEDSPSDYKISRWGELKDGFNALVDKVFSIQPLAGAGVFRQDSQLGRQLSVNPGGGGAPPKHPFHVEDASDVTHGTRVRVYYGKINNVAPLEMSPADDPPCYISVGAFDTVLWLQVDTDEAHHVSEVSIGVGADDDFPSDNETDGTYYLLLASIEVDTTTNSVACLDNLTGSQTFFQCRNWFSNPATYGATFSVI